MMNRTDLGTGINKFKGFSALTQLLLINGLIFLLGNLVVNLADKQAMNYLMLPSRMGELAYKFYTPFTYMFTHLDLSHAFFNMIYLFSMGQIFMSILGGKRLWFVYLGGGLAGAVFFLILFNTAFAAYPAYLLGASAAATAIAITCAVYVPNMPVHIFIAGPFPLKWVVLVWFALSTLIDISDNTGGKVSHLGGALFGLLYALQLKKGNDWTESFNLKSLFQKKRKKPVKVYQATYTKPKAASEEKTLDDILDKINRSGYESLTNQEKKTLQEIASKK